MKEQNEKQAIEELAQVLDKAKEDALATIGSLNRGWGTWYAEAVYAAGYRKQSEWISVDDRLPEECTHVIVHDEDGTVGEAFYSSGGYFEWVANEGIAFSTHWMPLPEPPKGAGNDKNNLCLF